MGKIRDPEKVDRILIRDRFICAYCGFDGRSFNSWMQLTIDHILPQSQDGSDDEDNLITSCPSCNSITSQMTFDTTDKTEIISQKRAKVAKHRLEVFERWRKSITTAI